MKMNTFAGTARPACRHDTDVSLKIKQDAKKCCLKYVDLNGANTSNGKSEKRHKKNQLHVVNGTIDARGPTETRNKRDCEKSQIVITDNTSERMRKKKPKGEKKV